MARSDDTIRAYDEQAAALADLYGRLPAGEMMPILRSAPSVSSAGPAEHEAQLARTVFAELELWDLEVVERPAADNLNQGRS